MRLKSLFRKDMSVYQHIPLSSPRSNLSPSNTTGKHKTAARSLGNAAAATSASASASISNNANMGSIGDYVLIDLLLGDVDLDTFVKVEAHYIKVLQKRVFRAWSSAVEDVNSTIHL